MIVTALEYNVMYSALCKELEKQGVSGDISDLAAKLTNTVFEAQAYPDTPKYECNRVNYNDAISKEEMDKFCDEDHIRTMECYD